jgi:hypothetical protein
VNGSAPPLVDAIPDVVGVEAMDSGIDARTVVSVEPSPVIGVVDDDDATVDPRISSVVEVVDSVELVVDDDDVDVELDVDVDEDVLDSVGLVVDDDVDDDVEDDDVVSGTVEVVVDSVELVVDDVEVDDDVVDSVDDVVDSVELLVDDDDEVELDDVVVVAPTHDGTRCTVVLPWAVKLSSQ